MDIEVSKQKVIVVGSDSISQEIIQLLMSKGVDVICADKMTKAEKLKLDEPICPVILEDLSLDSFKYPQDNHCWWQQFEKKKNKHKR
jgi:saccharopine dehydrogenase-like NADP-dependent oxidoreductase